MKNNDNHLILHQYPVMVQELQKLVDDKIDLNTEEGLIQAKQTVFYNDSQKAQSLDLKTLPSNLVLAALNIAKYSYSITFLDARDLSLSYSGAIAVKHIASFPNLKYADISENSLQVYNNSHIDIIDDLNKSSSLIAVSLKNNFSNSLIPRILKKAADNSANIVTTKLNVNNLFQNDDVLPSLLKDLQHLVKEYAFEEFSASSLTFIFDKKQLELSSQSLNNLGMDLELELSKQQMGEEMLNHHLEELGLCGMVIESSI